MLDKKRVKNFTLPTSPMYELIVGPQAALLVGKVVRVRGNNEIKCAFESEFGEGSGNENLELLPLPPGQIGFITGITEVKTVLKFLVIEEENGVKQGVYHVKFIDLEPIDSQPERNENG